MKFSKKLKIKEEIRESLKNLGLTDYIINIYIGLLKFGEKNAHDLSDLTKVPYSRIYEVLNEMVDRKIINKLAGRPSTFIANDPKKIFSTIKKKQDQIFTVNMETSLPHLSHIFGDKITIKEESLTIIEGNKACRDYFRNILNYSNRSLVAVIRNMDEIFPVIKMNLRFLKIKETKVKIIIEEKFKNADFIETIKKYGELRFLPEITHGIFVSDDKVAIQIVRSHFNIAKPKEVNYTIFSGNSDNYIQLINEIFKRSWKNSLDENEKKLENKTSTKKE